MDQAQEIVTFRTGGPGFTDITTKLAGWLTEADAATGMLNVFIRHTSASLVIQENADRDVQRDLETALAKLAPEHDGYAHQSEGPDDMPAHIKSALTATSLAIPVADGAMALGTWQGVFLIEHRARPRAREIMLLFQGVFGGGITE